MPHCESAEVETPKLAIGVLREPVDFNAPDGSLAKMIVLLVTPASNNDLQPQMLANLARIIGDDNVRGEILSADSAAEIKATIRMAEAAKASDGHGGAAGGH